MNKVLFGGAVVVGVICAPVDFVLFGLTLAGVALFHHHTLQVALIGLAAVTLYKLGFTGFNTGPGLGGLGLYMAHEWIILTNPSACCSASRSFPTTSSAARSPRCCRTTCRTTGRAGSCSSRCCQAGIRLTSAGTR